MTRQKFKGDNKYGLPAQQVEPYRIWFEFLNLALRDPSVRVHKALYHSWGDIENVKFDDWWEANWRRLFSVDIGVSIFDPDSSHSSNPDKEIIVRVPLYQDPKRSLKQISSILNEKGASKRLKDMADGQFRLQIGRDSKATHPSIRFLRNLPKVRLLLNIYRYWIEHQGVDDRERLDRAVLSYYKWATTWNSKVKERKWKRPIIEVPFAMTAYVKYLEEKGSRKRLKLYESKSGDVSDHRRQIARYIRKARKLSVNVSKGIFPGAYD
jgi:hypothetical protein